MTTDANKNDDKPSETGDAESTGNFPGCGPECGCGEPADKGNSKIKIAICLVVVVAVCGILLFKTTSARQNAPGFLKSGFSNPFATKGKGVVLNSAGQQGGSGASLSAIAELNTVAAKLDTVFLAIPSKDNAPTTKETGAALAAVERTLNAKGLSTGIFTLQTASPDYTDVAAKMTPPGIAILTKGRGIGFVSGGISETNLMQAYVASTRGGGCGPGGCPPSGGGKSAVPCN
jgi:hypothetical protein